ncbi:MAG TPA: succinate--CoA ligase subunit beta, partial [Candidatus Poseidoniales archaeon]
LFIDSDCSMIEINPLVRTASGDMIALDAKVSFDDNALFRHPEWENVRDLSEEEEIEVRAKETGLSYVKLDGDIGCMVNGAGLAMATMDVIKLYGGEPANFLDVGGGANEDQVTTAFSIILEDPNVKGILVNIFGGIMRCDIIANGIIAAVGKLGLSDPLVVRLAGTNVDEGKAILKNSGLNIHPADSLAEGAEKIVNLIQGGV